MVLLYNHIFRPNLNAFYDVTDLTSSGVDCNVALVDSRIDFDSRDS